MPNPPKSAEVRRREGNRGHRAIPENPKAAEGWPTMPPGMPPVARAAWRRYGKVLAEMHVLTVADGLGLELIARAYADWREAEKAVQAHGMTYTTRNEAGAEMVRPRPEVAMRANAWARLNSALSQFGLSPVARARIHLKPEKKGNLRDFLRGRERLRETGTGG